MSSCCSTRKSSIWPLVIVAVLLGGVMYVRGRHAPTPPMFDESVTLQAALAQSASTGKPVFVLATADWCGSCQSLKRGALADDKLTAEVSKRAIPVYLDATSESSQGYADAANLGVRGYPTLILISDGQILASRGPGSASTLLDWFDKAIPALPAPAALPAPVPALPAPPAQPSEG